MEFSTILQSLKTRKMSIISVAISSFLFIVISDKLALNGIIHNIYSMQFQHPETVFMGAMNISKWLTLQYSFLFGIGYLFVELATFMAITIAVFAIIKHVFGFEIVEENSVDISPSRYSFQTNDIYLQTSKFIC